MGGRTQYWKPGDWNAICDRCGQIYKATDLRLTWDNLRVCPKDFELRPQQDFARSIKDPQAVPWTRALITSNWAPGSQTLASPDTNGSALQLMGGNATTPNLVPNFTFTSLIDAQAQIAPSQWASGANQAIVGQNGAGALSFQFGINATGAPYFTYSPDGSTQYLLTCAQTLAPTVPLWVRALLNPTAGSVTFYSGEDNVNWTQLGAIEIGTPIAGVFNSTVPLEIGTYLQGAQNPFAGFIFNVNVYNGVTDEMVVNFNPWAALVTQRFFWDNSGLPWTLNGAARIAVV